MLMDICNIGPEILGTATVNDKGQLVIPKEAREEVGLSAGDRLIVARHPTLGVLMLVKPKQLEARIGMYSDSLDKIKSDIATSEGGKNV